MTEWKYEMPYVMRDESNKVVAASLDDAQVPAEGWELVSAQAPEYLQFLESAMQDVDPFRESDIHLARVLEDLVNVLIDRDVIRFTDLPEAARKRLLDRQALRQRTQLSNILDDNPHQIIHL